MAIVCWHAEDRRGDVDMGLSIFEKVIAQVDRETSFAQERRPAVS
ncbi:MAG: hypothetical protein WBP93_15395 [Pyrinomonadaceae bacterium]